MIRKITSTGEPLFYEFRYEIEKVCANNCVTLYLSDYDLFKYSLDRDVERIVSCFDLKCYEEVEKIIDLYF
jgi:hypothetical protein